MGNDYVVTILSADDVISFCRLLQAMGKVESTASAKRRVQDMFDNSSHLLGLAKADGEAIGYAWAQNYGPHIRSGDTTARLHDLFVLPEHRGNGVGKRLFEFVVGWARDSGVTYLQWQGSKEAIPFYASLGLDGDTKSDLEEHPFYELKL